MMNFYPKALFIILACCIFSFSWAQDSRSFDGSNNNLASPEFGTKGQDISVLSALTYNDSKSQPNGVNRPNPRTISNAIFSEESLAPKSKRYSNLVWLFGEYIYRDIYRNSFSEEKVVSKIDSCDANFDVNCTGQVSLTLFRSAHKEGSGLSEDNPRRFQNWTTAWVDGSTVYGDSKDRANWLRSFEGGKLRTSSGNLPPLNTMTGEISASVDPNTPELVCLKNQKHFVTGDPNVNEHAALVALNTIFVREHNRICNELVQRNPGWNDEQIYQKARSMVIGMIQHILYDEYLPKVGVNLSKYSGYDATLDPMISNEFASSGLNICHSIMSTEFKQMNDRCAVIMDTDMSFQSSFYDAYPTIRNGVDFLLKGLASTPQNILNTKSPDDIRNMKLQIEGEEYLMDRVMANIVLGRERGLPDFNTLRSMIGLTKYRSFEEITKDKEVVENLKSTYTSVDDMDPWVGILAEDHMSESMFGETGIWLLSEQFRLLRSADRYFYMNDNSLSPEELDMIKKTSLSDIILRNTSITYLQENAFDYDPLCLDSNEERKHLFVSIYPNPVTSSSLLSIYGSKEIQVNVEIVNIFGQVLSEKVIELQKGYNECPLSKNTLLPGTYVLKIQEGLNQRQLKFVVAE